MLVTMSILLGMVVLVSQCIYVIFKNRVLNRIYIIFLSALSDLKHGAKAECS